MIKYLTLTRSIPYPWCILTLSLASINFRSSTSKMKESQSIVCYILNIVHIQTRILMQNPNKKEKKKKYHVNMLLKFLHPF
jgi:hypothetical protein